MESYKLEVPLINLGSIYHLASFLLSKLLVDPHIPETEAGLKLQNILLLQLSL